MSIKIMKAADDVVKVVGRDGKTSESLVIRGVIDPECLNLIQVAPYQREILPGAQVKALMDAMKCSSVPDVELGMRGDKHQVRRDQQTGDTTYHLQEQVFVIDGLQRLSAAKTLMRLEPGSAPRIGALVHFDTTEEWEAERFRILNQDRTKLNPNVLLRNLRNKHEAVDMVYRLSQDESFVLSGRVQWHQRMARTEIIPAMTLCHAIGFLHSRFGPGRGQGNPSDVASQLDKTMEVVGRTTMRDNIKTFFGLIDECFGVKRIVYRNASACMRRTFLIALADIFTRHNDFWRSYRLFIERDLRFKISKFAINDPEIVRLASSGGQARVLFYHVMLDHINSGKRTRRLTPVDGTEPKAPEAEENGVTTEELTGK